MNIQRMVNELLFASIRGEKTCVEYKLNNTDPEMIGQYISALSNAATLEELPFAYLIWGVEDSSYKVVGTDFHPIEAKKGNELLPMFLTFHTEPKVAFDFCDTTVEEKRVVILRIPAAQYQPTSWNSRKYIRIGTSKVELSRVPEIERKLWRVLEIMPVESNLAAVSREGEQVLSLLDTDAYFRLRGTAIPSTYSAVLQRFVDDRMILKDAAGTYDIPSSSALLFAKRLSAFTSLRNRILRIVTYVANNRVDALHEAPTDLMDVGYASGFLRFIDYIEQQQGMGEIIGAGQREQTKKYPEKAVRELLANALIHQDLTVSGIHPMVEIFADRIEFSNPGLPLIDPLRFVDEKRSRNERIAELMHQCRLCERRGSGIDRALEAIEAVRLPAPKFTKKSAATVATLYAPKALNKMNREEKIHACYFHACLQHEYNLEMTNSTLRQRLGISDANYSIASRILADAVEDKLILPADPTNTSKKLSRYIPFWASDPM